MNKKFLKNLVLTLLTIVMSAQILTITVFAESPEVSTDGGTTAVIDTLRGKLCIKDQSSITAVIEEPMDYATFKDEKEKTQVIDCIRVNICNVSNDNKVSCESFIVEPGTKVTAAEHQKIYYNPVQVFISKSGVDMLYFYIGAIYRWGASMIGVIAVLVIVISGIQISAAGGEQAVVTSAKTRITQSLIGIVILFLSGIILYTINPTFFTQ